MSSNLSQSAKLKLGFMNSYWYTSTRVAATCPHTGHVRFSLNQDTAQVLHAHKWDVVPWINAVRFRASMQMQHKRSSGGPAAAAAGFCKSFFDLQNISKTNSRDSTTSETEIVHAT
jgi:hypothetical protein